MRSPEPKRVQESTLRATLDIFLEVSCRAHAGSSLPSGPWTRVLVGPRPGPPHKMLWASGVAAADRGEDVLRTVTPVPNDSHHPPPNASARLFATIGGVGMQEAVPIPMPLYRLQQGERAGRVVAMVWEGSAGRGRCCAARSTPAGWPLCPTMRPRARSPARTDKTVQTTRARQRVHPLEHSRDADTET